jgi:hypothetical protein
MRLVLRYGFHGSWEVRRAGFLLFPRRCLGNNWIHQTKDAPNRTAKRRRKHRVQSHRRGIRHDRPLRPVTWAILQEVIGVLAVLNALRAAFPPKVIHDLKAGPGLKTL